MIAIGPFIVFPVFPTETDGWWSVELYDGTPVLEDDEPVRFRCYEDAVAWAMVADADRGAA